MKRSNIIGRHFEAAVIGTSAGGLKALTFILEGLVGEIPVIIVQHRSRDDRNLLETMMQEKCKMKVKQTDEKEEILAGTIYFAPPDYHLLIEQNRTFSLSYDAPVHFSRPSIDVLFESAATVYRQALLGIILTGANSDGADGIVEVRKRGGFTIAENPVSAAFPTMPQAAINTGSIDKIMSLEQIRTFLINANNKTFPYVQSREG